MTRFFRGEVRLSAASGWRWTGALLAADIIWHGVAGAGRLGPLHPRRLAPRLVAGGEDGVHLERGCGVQKD